MPTSVSAPDSFLPPMLIVPCEASSSPATINISVLLPQPLGPTTETNSPGSMSIVVGSSAWNGVAVSSP